VEPETVSCGPPFSHYLPDGRKLKVMPEEAARWPRGPGEKAVAWGFLSVRVVPSVPEAIHNLSMLHITFLMREMSKKNFLTEHSK
jgi:hypothetical protein